MNEKVKILVDEGLQTQGAGGYVGILAKLVSAIAVSMALIHIGYVGDFFAKAGLWIDPIVFRASHLAFALALTFLLVPAKGRTLKSKPPWYDVLLLCLGVGANLYFIFSFGDIQLRVADGTSTSLDTLLTWINIIIVLEATRRHIGIAFPIITAFFLFYAMFGNLFPGFMETKGFGFERVARYVGTWSDGVYGAILGMSATVIIMFLIFAEFLRTSGAGEFFTKLALALMGSVRGGGAKVAIVASSLMGTISGTAVGNVAACGAFTIPLMKRVGYKAHVAAGIEAAASNGGQIMPPVMGIAAFLMAEFLGVSYAKIAIAAIFPALLYYIALFVMVDLEAAKTGMKGIPRSELPPLRQTLKEGWHYFVPLAVLIILLIVVLYSPQKSALWAVLGLIVVSMFKKQCRMGPKAILKGLQAGAESTMMVACTCACAGIILGSLNLTGLGYKLAGGLIDLSQGNMVVLLVLTAIVCIILGMGLNTSGVYVTVAIMIAPALVRMGVLPIAAHFFVFYFGVAALITPPVCPAAYVAASIAGAKPMQAGWAATRFGVITFLAPFAFVLSPVLLLQGTISDIVLPVITAVIGTIALGAGIQGCLFKSLNWPQRISMIVAGPMLIIPHTAIPPIGLITNIVGALIVAVPTVLQIIGHLQKRGASAAAS